MRKGDISNDLPKRVLVTTDVFVSSSTIKTRKFKIIPKTSIKMEVRREILSYLYLYTTNKGITLELVSFDYEGDKLQELVNFLDSAGTNPFRYHTYYSSVKKLVNELPYRPEVIGVLDMPTRLLQYGHWGLDLGSL